MVFKELNLLDKIIHYGGFLGQLGVRYFIITAITEVFYSICAPEILQRLHVTQSYL